MEHMCLTNKGKERRETAQYICLANRKRFGYLLSKVVMQALFGRYQNDS